MKIGSVCYFFLRYCFWPGCSMVFGAKASHDKKTSPSFRCASPSLRCAILRYCLWPGVLWYLVLKHRMTKNRLLRFGVRLLRFGVRLLRFGVLFYVTAFGRFVPW